MEPLQTIVLRVLLARGALQAAVAGTIDLAVLFSWVDWTAEQVAGVNVVIVLWLGFAAAVGQRRDLDDLDRLLNQQQ